MRPLHEKIYLSCYLIPLYIEEIAKFIYGTESNRRVSDAIRWMPNENDSGMVWLEEYSYHKLPIQLKEKITSEPEDKRGSARKYFYAKPEPLLDSIITDLSKGGIILSDIEKEKLNALLDSNEFRLFVHNHIRKHKREFDLNKYESNFLLIKQALSRHCSITNEYNILLMKGVFKNQEEKQNMLKQRLSNIEIPVIPEIRDLIENMPRELIIKLSQLDVAVYSEIHKLFNMFARFNEESLRIYNE